MPRKPVPLTVEQKAAREVEIFEQQSAERHKIAQRAYDHQSASTQRALDVMVERIISLSRGVIIVKVGGQKMAAVISDNAIAQNALYLATEIFKDLAILDMRVEEYEFVPGFCAECGKEISKPKKKGKR